jgi:hypothetical protein
LKQASIVRVYSRDKKANKGKELQPDYSANFADVVYDFPFPPKELGVIANREL